MGKLPKEAVRRLLRLSDAADPPPPLDSGPDPDISGFVLPVVRRGFGPVGLSPPLRRTFDYQSSSRRALLIYECARCGGPVPSKDAHDEDAEACEREKVRQVMES